MNSERKLRHIRQITSVSAYIQEFEKLRQYVTWNESALRYTFYDGLWGSVKDLMLSGGVPNELNALKDLALRIDARMEGRKVEKQSYTSKSSTIASQGQRSSNSAPTGSRPATSWNTTLRSPPAYRPSTANPATALGSQPPPNATAPRANFPSHTADGTGCTIRSW